MKTLKNIWAVLALIATISFSTTANSKPSPSGVIYIQSWISRYKPVNENCLGGSCGSASSVHPQRFFIDSDYNHASYGQITKYQLQFIDVGPVYHQQSYILDSLFAYPPTPPEGSHTVAQSTDNWETGTTNTTAISSLDIGEHMAWGHLQKTITDPSGDFENNITLTETANSVIKLANGVSGCRYVFRVYFYAEQFAFDAQANMVSQGFVPCTHLEINGLPTGSVHDASGYLSGWCYFDVELDADLPNQLIDVTPIANTIPYYTYGYATPFINAVYYPDDNE